MSSTGPIDASSAFAVIPVMTVDSISFICCQTICFMSSRLSNGLPKGCRGLVLEIHAGTDRPHLGKHQQSLGTTLFRQRVLHLVDVHVFVDLVAVVVHGVDGVG